ncbi:MAG TPA: hypothetical protein VIK01_04480 [Polyangiaceae bacterium]
MRISPLVSAALTSALAALPAHAQSTPEATPKAESVAAPAVAAPAAPTPIAPAAPPIVPSSFGRKFTTWDASLDAGYGHQFGDNARGLWLGRAGAGLLFVRDPTFYTLGLSYEYSTLSRASLGLDAEVMQLDSGLWVQARASSDLDHGMRPGASLSLGWSLFAIEADVRSRESGAVTALYGKLRIPLGLIGFALQRH